VLKASISALLLAAATQPQTATLTCGLSSYAGCNESGECVGLGAKSKTLRLLIDTRTNLVSLNDIRANVDFHDEVDDKGRHELRWFQGLISYNYLTIVRRTDGWKAGLSDNPGKNHIYFDCSERR